MKHKISAKEMKKTPMRIKRKHFHVRDSDDLPIEYKPKPLLLNFNPKFKKYHA